MSHTTVLVVDDEPRLLRVVEMLLTDAGHQVRTATTLAEARRAIDAVEVDVALIDLKLPDGTGLDLLAHIQQHSPELPAIIMTAFGTIETAVRAMQLGARTYLVKPFDAAQVETVVTRALEWRRAQRHDVYRRDEAVRNATGIIGRDPAVLAVLDTIARVGPTTAPVLVLGATGTGKELVARALHAASQRDDGLFVAVNCAAIPAPLLEAELFGVMRGAFTGAHADRAGKFELADGGTLFLDEIGDMPLEMQAKLLRVLEDGVVERLGGGRPRRVDVRIIAATHRDLDAMVKAGSFRSDLFYRLAVIRLVLPTLRARPADLPLLADDAVARFAKRLGRSIRLAPDAYAVLRDYDWPGNVRELHNVLERATLLADGPVIGGDALAELVTPPMTPSGSRVEAREVPALADVVAAAERLGISVRTLWYKLRRLGLAADDDASH